MNFATDAWTALNHKAFIAVTVHLEQQEQGEALAFLLDIIEVPRVRMDLLECYRIDVIADAHQPSFGRGVCENPG